MTHASSVQAGDLARLLETERRLGARLRAARAEADALVAQAQTAAERREAALAAELEAEERLADERLTREHRKREREIADAAQRQIEAYQRIPARRLAEIAKTLARRLLEEDST
jgi:hypothetical protein